MNEKIKVILSLLRYFITSYPQRLKRFLLFYLSMSSWKRPFSFLEWILLFIDLTGLPEFYQMLHELFNWKLRTPTPKELWIGHQIFESSINWNVLRVNDDNRLVCKRMHIAFVSFHTIHYHEDISDGIFIHELVHVWQYEKFGSAYIVRALHAQNTKEGYDYGGLQALTYRKRLDDYNFEQMAEIIRHGFELKGKSTQHNNFIMQLQEY